MDSDNPCAPLFSPFAFGTRTLRNRFVMAPMTRRRSVGGFPGDDTRSYYRLRAEGGVALIVTEGGYIDANSFAANPEFPLFSGDSLAAWGKALADARAAGAWVIPQIWQAYPPPDVLCQPEMAIHPRFARYMEKTYAEAAARIREAGFDGVELHGGGKHTTDLFAPDRETAAPVAGRIVRAVRRAVGKDFPIALRISEWRRSDGATPFVSSDAELRNQLLPCAEAGVDVFDMQTDHFLQVNGGKRTLASCWAAVAQELRPAIAGGGISSSDPAVISEHLRLLAKAADNKEISLLALGRPLLSDPQWVQKCAAGRLDEIIPYESGKSA
jgi:2,4-dienoyl-CoA reductase-like NADH-dependent reductase (Old Yellow Enzyme family)